MLCAESQREANRPTVVTVHSQALVNISQIEQLKQTSQLQYIFWTLQQCTESCWSLFLYQSRTWAEGFSYLSELTTRAQMFSQMENQQTHKAWVWCECRSVQAFMSASCWLPVSVHVCLNCHMIRFLLCEMGLRHLSHWPPAPEWVGALHSLSDEGLTHFV